ncbi:MAG: UDP-N-acetylglucosamine 2-epimerase (hydrolyzing) [Thermoflexales bacterium]|nr:UDP-N-acetylglucosamine 2-epimerase (hydrolyzing) [Thermoflexales bacterium]
MRSIGVVTTARADYGIYRPILQQLQADTDIELRVLVTGMHLSPQFGLTVRAIEADGFPITERVEMLLASDSPEGVAKSIGLGVIGFAQAYARSKPDMLVVLGDRFEMYAAALAAVPFTIPIAHIHGGEVTQGAIDEALRHSLTKLSHLHFVSTAEYARRVRQLGEEPWRVSVSGAPSLDNLRTVKLFSLEEVGQQYGVSLHVLPLLVTFHPVTLEQEQAEAQITELLAALAEADLPVIFTGVNADTGGRVIQQKISDFVQTRPAAWMMDNLGTRGYFSLMQYAAAMVGNSSSGLIEAPSFELPVVNIGTRQTGRVRAANVIDVGTDRAAILAGIRRAVQPEFRANLRGLLNPYGDGTAAEKIVARLKSVELDQRLIMKRFIDWPEAV